MGISRRRIALVLASAAILVANTSGGLLHTGTATAAADSSACIAALRADRTGALHLASAWLDAYNATAVGSTIARLETSINTYRHAALTDYQKAYSYALAGNKTTAKTWAAKGAKAITSENAAIDKYNAAIDDLNSMVDKNDQDATTLTTQMNATDQTCAGL